MHTYTIVHHVDYKTAKERITRIHQLYKTTRRVENLCIFGSTGTGKSTLLEEYERSHPRSSSSEGDIVPVLVVSVPAQPTIRGLMVALLQGMRAPLADSGSAAKLYQRFIILAEECGVELILIDEVQHFVDRGTVKTHGATADKLKEVSKRLRIPMVLAGAPRASILLADNAQLRRLFVARLRLRPFSLQHQFNGLRGFIAAIAKALELPNADGFKQEGVAERIFYATDGLPGHVVTLLQSLHGVIGDSASSWSLPELGKAFVDMLWVEAPTRLNPFIVSERTLLRRLIQPGEPYCPSVLDGDNHQPHDGLVRHGDHDHHDVDTGRATR